MLYHLFGALILFVLIRRITFLTSGLSILVARRRARSTLPGGGSQAVLVAASPLAAASTSMPEDVAKAKQGSARASPAAPAVLTVPPPRA